MPYPPVKTTIVAVILGLFACFAQAEAMPRLTLNEVSTPALPVGYGYGRYGRGYYGGGYGRGYYGRGYGRYGGRGYGGYGGGYSRGCGGGYY